MADIVSGIYHPRKPTDSPLWNVLTGTVIYHSRVTQGKNRKHFAVYTAEDFIFPPLFLYLFLLQTKTELHSIIIIPAAYLSWHSYPKKGFLSAPGKA